MTAAVRFCLALNRCFPKRKIAGRASPEDYVRAQRMWAERNFRFFAPYVELRDKVVLDAGCGPGGKTGFYASMGCKRIIGVDIDPERIRLAKASTHAEQHASMEFMVANLAQLPFHNDHFDIIFLNDVFEHVDRPILEKVLQELKRVLKPGGAICMEFPPWTSFDAGHLYDDIHIPWCQLIFSEATLISALEHLKAKDPVVGRLSTIEHFRELNRITIPEARILFGRLRFEIRVFRYERIKGIVHFAWWPWLDARLTRRVVAILSK
jgi:ubiquinone/menaquinone biosynthesis C-methylase UbiE